VQLATEELSPEPKVTGVLIEEIPEQEEEEEEWNNCQEVTILNTSVLEERSHNLAE
jgi:hypothetical protein